MQFSEGYTKIDPGCGCGSFAVPDHVYQAWRDNKIGWFCPHCGEGRVYRDGAKQRLERELERERKRVEALQNEKQMAEAARRNTERKYVKIRERVKNGVCPCCNRQFDNVLRHMRAKHPDFGNDRNLKTLRLMYGLTQSALADELGISQPPISYFENGKLHEGWAYDRIVSWLDAQAG